MKDLNIPKDFIKQVNAITSYVRMGIPNTLQPDPDTNIIYKIGGGVPVNPAFLSGLTVNSVFRYSDGTEQSGYVLTCDSLGNGTWSPISAATPSSGVTSISASTGLSASTTTGAVTLINTAPDQTVTITGGTNIQITGAYPDFGINFTGSTTGGTASGDYLPLSGGTVTGATIFQSGLTANTIYTDYIDFNTSSTPVNNEGRLIWNNADEIGGLEVTMMSGNTILQIGEENLARVYNADSITLTAGTVVYVFGSQGNTISVKRASNSGETTSSRALGVVSESIAVGERGFVNTFGLVKGLNTLAYTGGTPIWLGTTPGSWTSTEPDAPNHTVLIGFISRSASSPNGSLFVHISNGWELNELHNVYAPTPSNGDILKYSASTSVWVNSNTISLNGVSATTISAATYQNLPVSAVTSGTGISASTSNGVVTVSNTQVQGITGKTDGTGISSSISNNVISITNTDLGSSQNIFKNIQIAGVTQFSAGSNSSNLNFSGINLTITSASTNTLVFSAGTGSGGGTTVTGGTYSAGTLTLNNSTGGTVSVTGFPATTSFGVTVDGSGGVITTGQKGYIRIPYAFTITSWTLIGSPSGSITFDIWRTNNAIPTVANTIIGGGGTKPSLSTSTYATSSTLTNWTVTGATGDVIGWNVDSCTTTTIATLQLFVTRT